MNAVEEIIIAALKPKEKLVRLSEAVLEDQKLLREIIRQFAEGNDPVKGLCMETLEAASRSHPEWILAHIGFVSAQIGHRSPRVRWESSRVVANLAKDHSEKVLDFIPALLKNTRDEGTVVRWSAAFVLTEIVKSNEDARKKWISELQATEKKEENNRVKNVYKKAFRAMEKGQGKDGSK